LESPSRQGPAEGDLSGDQTTAPVKFKPQFLNGTAIPVVVILTVPFTLK
jgi:hypothetical protein